MIEHTPKWQKLRPKQRKFVQEYVKTSDITRSALAAGYKGVGASVTGSRMLRMPKIASEIERLTRKAEITATYVLTSIQAIADDQKTRNADKLRALELLGKNLRLFTDRVEVDVSDLAARVAEARKQANGKGNLVITPASNLGVNSDGDICTGSGINDKNTGATLLEDGSGSGGTVDERESVAGKVN